MRRLVRVVAVALLAAFAGSIGFLAAAAVIGVSDAIAPFRFPEDEGSVREFPNRVEMALIADLLSPCYGLQMSAARLLRTARRRAGLSQRALAEAVGMPQSTVARIELGMLSPRADTLERLLRGAGQSLAVEPLLGVGIDRTQIRELLRLTPTERAHLAAANVANMAEFARRRA